MELFALNEREELIINKTEVLVYPEFNKLYLKDSTKEKSKFRGLLRYMYFMLNPKAFPFQKGMTEAETTQYALKHSGITVVETSSSEFKACYKIYHESLANSTDELLKSSLAVLRNMHMLVKKLELDLDRAVKNPESDVDTCINLADSVQKIAKAIPEHIKTFEGLQETKIQEIKKRKIRGGKEWIPSLDGVGFEDESDGVSTPERVSS
jgi:hypothetical protein